MSKFSEKTCASLHVFIITVWLPVTDVRTWNRPEARRAATTPPRQATRGQAHQLYDGRNEDERW